MALTLRSWKKLPFQSNTMLIQC